jgi:hypothetical protein
LYNSRSIGRKTEVLSIIHDTYDPLIIGVTESWLTKKDLNAALNISDKYDILRRDRKIGAKGKKKGGGVCILLKHGTQFVQLDKETDSCESIWVDIVCDRPFRVGLFYRSDEKTADLSRQVHLELVKEILFFSKGQNKPCFIMGDFNFPLIDWEIPMCRENSEHAVRFVDCTLEAGLQQYVTEPTRGKNVLDLILCNDDSFVTNVDVSGPISSDHCLVTATVSATIAQPVDSEPVPAFHLAKYDQIAKFLDSVNFYDLSLEFLTANQYSQVIDATLSFCIEHFVPKMVVNRNGYMRRNRRIRCIQRQLQRSCGSLLFSTEVPRS